MGRVSFVFLAGLLVALVGEPGRASLYSPEDSRFVVPVGEDGKARALDFDEFKRRLAIALNARDDRKKADGHVNSDRAAFLERVGRAKGKKLTPVETVGLAADLVRLGDPHRLDEALDRVQPLVRDRNPNYFAFTTLAHIYSARGDWREAVAYQRAALLDAELPSEVKGLTRQQRDWIARLDRDYVLSYYELRYKEASATPRPNPVNEDVFPLFPVAERGKPADPVRFVNEAGAYEPGALAAVERAKLPSDAIPIVQQFMLWYPSDTRMYWLLAELYAADRQFGPARDIMDVSVSEARQFGNRRLLVEHRAAVRRVDDAQPRKSTDEPLLAPSTITDSAASTEPPAAKEPISMRTIWIYFAVVGVIALVAFIRAMSRRIRGHCGPGG